METTTEFTIKGTMGQALPFTGTPAEAEANYETHSFDPENDRCVYCDCRPWGVWAQYPCNDGDRVESQRLVYADGREENRLVKIIKGEIVATRLLTADDDIFDFTI
jgi:hypothetical protein